MIRSGSAERRQGDDRGQRTLLVTGGGAEPVERAAQPAVWAPIGEEQVSVARAAATASSVHSEECWVRWMQAVESNRSSQQHHSELASAMAQQAYAWAVYHCTTIDAAGSRPPPATTAP